MKPHSSITYKHLSMRCLPLAQQLATWARGSTNQETLRRRGAPSMWQVWVCGEGRLFLVCTWQWLAQPFHPCGVPPETAQAIGTRHNHAVRLPNTEYSPAPWPSAC